jgi:hypothetical protein
MPSWHGAQLNHRDNFSFTFLQIEKYPFLNSVQIASAGFHLIAAPSSGHGEGFPF